MPLLKVQDLCVSFKSGGTFEKAVEGVSFELEENETLSLVGESGCGKTATALSLLKLIPEAGRIDAGRAWYEGRDLLALSEREMRGIRGAKISMVFQEPMTSLNPVFTVGGQIAEAVRIHRRGGRKASQEEAVEVMARVGIPEPSRRYFDYPHQMSGGMRQRVMIAMALACRPKLLIADEPTTALDVTIQAQILDLIHRMRAELKMGVLFITHDLSVVSHVAERMAVMYAGVIVEAGRTEDLASEPLHPYTQALYRAIPHEGEGRKTLESIPGRVPPLRQIPFYCRFFERCPRAGAECKAREPDLREIRPGHFVRCVKA
ncbi:MAG: ABC transporter ATP-binding protein [Pseudomonadota bacterium]